MESIYEQFARHVAREIRALGGAAHPVPACAQVDCGVRLTAALRNPVAQERLSQLHQAGCHPLIGCGDAGLQHGGKTTDDLTLGPDGTTSPEIVMNCHRAGDVPQHHFDELLAHELVHARYSHLEAQTGRRPHVGAEEVEAYSSSGGCDSGGIHRKPDESRCECIQENAIQSCIDAGLNSGECRGEVTRAMQIPQHGCSGGTRTSAS